VGDKYSITGSSTGVLFGKIKTIQLEDASKTKNAKINQLITISVDKPVRKNDKLYIIKTRKIYD
jgi:hypothetical protein